MIINDDAQNLIDLLSSKQEIASVVVKEPTTLMLKVIQTKYPLLEDTFLFEINYNYNGVIGTLQMVLPRAIYKLVTDSYLIEKQVLADTRTIIQSSSEIVTLYYHPSNNETEALRKHSLVPMTSLDSDLQVLISKLEQIEDVKCVHVYEMFEDQADEVTIHCYAKDLDENIDHKHLLDMVSVTDNEMMIPLILHKDIITNVDIHNDIIENLKENIKQL